MIYFDSSAVLKLVLKEAESDEFASWYERCRPSVRRDDHRLLEAARLTGLPVAAPGAS